jgi:hypothetical protein
VLANLWSREKNTTEACAVCGPKRKWEIPDKYQKTNPNINYEKS